MRVHEVKQKTLLSKPHFQVPALFAVLVGLTFFGYYVTHLFAAGSATLYMSPASGSYQVGQTVTIQVLMNAGAEQINAVEADFTYPSNLQFVSFDTTGTAFPLQAAASASAGTVKIGRATNGGGAPVTGNGKLLTKVTFAVIGTGSSSLPFLASSHIVRSTDNSDALGTATGASFTLVAAPTPTPAPPAATPAPTAPPATHAPTPAPVGHAATPTPKAASKVPTPAAHAVTPTPVVQTTPTPAAIAEATASPTPVVAVYTTPPVTTPAPVPLAKKLATSPRLTMAAAAVAIPILALLIVGGLLFWRHRTPKFTNNTSYPSGGGGVDDSKDSLVYPESHPDHPNNRQPPQQL